jgi:hypothetical protein
MKEIKNDRLFKNRLKRTRRKSMASNAQTQREDEDSNKFSLLRLSRTRITERVECVPEVYF